MKNIKKQNPQPSELNEMSTVNNTKLSLTYVVIRAGHRVSDKEYTAENDEAAIAELKFWRNISKKYSYGEQVSIVKYDPSLHRVYGEPIRP